MGTVPIRGGTVVTEHTQFAGSVLARDGRVAGLFEHDDGPITADEVIDARGKFGLPGGVDVHCHFREPDPAEREAWRPAAPVQRPVASPPSWSSHRRHLPPPPPRCSRPRLLGPRPD